MLSLIDAHASYHNNFLDYISLKLFLLPHDLARNDQTESVFKCKYWNQILYFHFMVITLAVKYIAGQEQQRKV